VYTSLINQTFKDFVWLIIDDGSTDQTKDIVSGWINSNKLRIKYVYKKNEGKHTAMQMAYELCESKYVIGLDSDDEIVPNALEILDKHWRQIESDNLEDKYAEIRANSVNENGQIVGKYRIGESVEYLDVSWHKMVIRNGNNNEHISSRNVFKIKKCMPNKEVFWFQNKLKYISEYVFWARLGRNYKYTRYLSVPLRIYHTDRSDSLSNSSRDASYYYSQMVSDKYFLDENLRYILLKPRYFISMAIRIGICSIILSVRFQNVVREFKSINSKMFFALNYPLAVLANLYFLKIRRKYWS
jgi:glycosyltransferase involved in cell wall biosynthesis